MFLEKIFSLDSDIFVSSMYAVKYYHKIIDCSSVFFETLGRILNFA